MEQPSQHLHEKYRKKKQIDRFLIPVQETLKVRGKIFYHESAQAHSMIRLTKDVLSHYPQLREKSSSFSYVMIVPSSKEELNEQFKKMKENVDEIPIILFLERNSAEE